MMTASLLGGGRMVLTSASKDGLVVLHDPSALTEENALLSVVNFGSPVRRIGFFGLGYEGLYALTGNETMGCYHWDSGQKVCDVGGGGMGLRRALSDAVSSGGVTVIALSSPLFASGMMADDDFDNGDNAIDYLVGC